MKCVMRQKTLKGDTGTKNSYEKYAEIHNKK